MLRSSLEFQFVGQAELLLSPGKFLKDIPRLTLVCQMIQLYKYQFRMTME